MDGLGQQGVLQVIPPAELERQLQARSQQQAQQNAAMQSQPQDPGELAQWVRGRFDVFRNHRNTAAGWSERLLQALRTFNGQYDQTRLQEIRRFGGSEIFVRMSSQKCRAASSLLRDIYLSQDRPWAVRPPSNPAVSPQVVQMINQLVQQEAMQLSQQAGGGPAPGRQDRAAPARAHGERRGRRQEEGGQAGPRERGPHRGYAALRRLLPRPRRVPGGPASLPVRLHQGPGGQGDPHGGTWPKGGGAAVGRDEADADVEPGQPVRHLVHPGRRGHRERRGDREAARHARRTERPPGPPRVQLSRASCGAGRVWPRRPLRRVGHDRRRARSAGKPRKSGLEPLR
jgi:hypothetical protein